MTADDAARKTQTDYDYSAVHSYINGMISKYAKAGNMFGIPYGLYKPNTFWICCSLHSFDLTYVQFMSVTDQLKSNGFLVEAEVDGPDWRTLYIGWSIE